MKTIAPVAPFLVWLCAVLLTAEAARAELTPAGILADMQRVADWQPTNGPDKGPHGWVEAVADAGYSALAGISGEARYRDQLRAQSEKNQWLLRGLLYHADDHCVGQMYAELYQIYREPRMLDTMRQHFDYVLTHPSGVTNLSMAQPHAFVQKRWSWCDALFMAPPAWLRLWAVTGAKEYRDFAMTNFWATSEYLYDRDEHLYYRDSRYFTMQEANGKKVFWSRGNGWVLAGMARMLEYLPNNDPDRPRLEAHFREMAGRILSLQQPDGSWHSSLLDPDSFPTPEASGTGLDTFALAWGVNAGLLDRAKIGRAHV